MKIWQLGLTLGVVVFLFALVIYPTPYQFMEQGTNAWRVNRFSGVKELATSSGWRVEGDLKSLNGFSLHNNEELKRSLTFQAREGLVLSYELTPFSVVIHYKDGSVVSYNPSDVDELVTFIRGLKIPKFETESVAVN